MEINKHYKPMVDLLADTYQLNKIDVAYDLNKLEDIVRCKEIMKDSHNYNKEYWLLSAGKLSETYKGNVK